MSGTSARSSHLSQPVVKSVLVYRNGDPFFAGRRVVIHEKKVSSFDVFLKEVTGGVQAPFGAVRNIYTPRTGHRIRKLDQIESGGNYVAGGPEAFKKLNYLDIGDIKKRPMEVINTEFFSTGPGGDEKKKFEVHRSFYYTSVHLKKVLCEESVGGVDLLSSLSCRLTRGLTISRRLYTLEGKLVESGTELENGQFYVAVGRDKFKKLPYSELLFDKSTMRRPYGQKASSLPPIVGSRRSKGSGNDRQSKSTIGSSDNSSPQPLKRKGKKDVSAEKPTKAKQSMKLKGITNNGTMSGSGDANVVAEFSPQASAHVKYHCLDEGIFKAGAERSETRGAVEVQEDEDTQVELPVDQRPAEIVDEEEDGEKTNKDTEQKEDFSGMNGEVEDVGREAGNAPEQGEEILDHSEKEGPAHIKGGTDEENGEELDQVNELQPTVEGERKSQGADNGQDEADLDSQRPPRPEVKITSPQDNENNEQNKDYAAVA
ncbi:PREDICTED: doublecortin domain-containing protein 2 [Dipodomys ordii]|uniref:Doublecortin domain-containing protein 2 n=1 Tax=Dipodomys ordii TaxID=10020 RepID=A0A1S3GPP2_DIPOR|nr:PREDICTED: doublecortin domain-containing protein 2 [Dipodomys ordii]